MQVRDCQFRARQPRAMGKFMESRAAAVEIDCVDCHGTIRRKGYADKVGRAAPGRTAAGEPRGRRLDGVALRRQELRRFELAAGQVVSSGR